MKFESIESQSVVLSSQLEGMESTETLENVSNLESQEVIRVSESQEEVVESYEKSHHPIEKPEVLTDFETTQKIADYLESVDEIKFEKWSKLSLEQKKEVLNRIEQNVASIEHRPALRVELEQMKPRTMGYQSADEYKIALNTLYVGSNDSNMHRAVIDTIIHEGRHAYQHYNVDVKLIHESGSEVASWKENFYDPKYQYYHSTGNKIVIPYNDGSMHDVDFRLYYYQPVEIDARNFANEVMSRLEHDGLVSKTEESQMESINGSASNSDENPTNGDSLENKKHESKINLTDEDIKRSQFIIKMGEFGAIDPLDEIQGHVKGFHVIDWNDTEFFKPIEVESDVTVVKDHLTNKLYICDSAGFKTELQRTTPEQEKATGFKYCYENIGHATIAIKDVRTFNPSEKEINSAIKDLQSYGFSEKDAADLMGKDPDKGLSLIKKYKDADVSLDEMKKLIRGDFSFNELPIEKSISFEGNAEDRRNSEASKFQDELSREHIYPGSIYKSDTWGGFDDYTTTKIKDAINRARSEGRISDSTYQRLMTDLKKASHYA